MLKHKHYSALFIIIIGIGTTLGSLEYGMGTLSRMGPGYFPLMLGAVLTLIGILIAVTPDSPDEVLAEIQHEPLGVIVRRRFRTWSLTIIGVIAFIIFGRYGGLLPATFILILVSALGDPKNSLKHSFWLAIGVIVFTIGAFHYGLQMQFPLFTWG